MEKTKFQFYVPYWQRQVVIARGSFYCEIEAASKEEALETFQAHYEDGYTNIMSIYIDAQENDLEMDENYNYNIDLNEVKWVEKE